jgi:hypothetical protein
MTPSRMFMKTRSAHLVCALSVLISGASCSLVAKVTGGGKPTPSSAGGAKQAASSSVSEAPKVEASESDSPKIHNLLRNLNAAEEALAKSDFKTYGLESRRLNQTFYVEKAIDNEAKGGQLKARLATLDMKAVKSIGGLIGKHYGDGKRVTEVKNPEVIEAMDKAIDLCEDATVTHGVYNKGETYATRLADNMKKYEEALDRAMRVDPNIIRYVGRGKSGDWDVPAVLIACEGQIAAHRLNLEDEYVEEVPPDGSTEKKGCGRVTWLADGVLVGANKFAEYTRTEGGQSWTEEIACNKIPKKDKVGKELARAIKEFRSYNTTYKGLVFVVKAKPYVEESKDDYRLHKWQEIEAYAKEMPLRANPCGGEKVFCEAGGSKGGKMFNIMEHAIDRGDAHAGVRPERCKNQLKFAFKVWEEFRDFRDDLKKSGEWIEGATYKTKKGEKLPEKDFVAKFEKLGKLADTRVLGDYCTKPAAPAAKPETKPAAKPGKK